MSFTPDTFVWNCVYICGFQIGYVHYVSQMSPLNVVYNIIIYHLNYRKILAILHRPFKKTFKKERKMSRKHSSNVIVQSWKLGTSDSEKRFRSLPLSYVVIRQEVLQAQGLRSSLIAYILQIVIVLQYNVSLLHYNTGCWGLMPGLISTF